MYVFCLFILRMNLLTFLSTNLSLTFVKLVIVMFSILIIVFICMCVVNIDEAFWSVASPRRATDQKPKVYFVGYILLGWLCA